MATTTNGTLTPPSLPPAPSPPSLTKRKRSDAETVIVSVNGVSASAKGKLVNGVARPVQAVVDDIYSVLKGYDTKPSILEQPITPPATRSASSESDSKRTKFTPPTGASSIASSVQNGSYTSLDALEKDVESAVSEVLSSIDSGDRSTVQPSLGASQLQAKVLAFQKLASSLLSREQTRATQPPRKQETTTITVEKSVGDSDAKADEVKEEVPESRTVLTLYGNAGGPKQLFSSLQQQTRVPSTTSRRGSGLDTAIKVTLPLRESSLPNIISTTEVFPMPRVEDVKRKNKTIGETFRAPAHVPQLSPPKPAKPMTTKGNTVTFVPPDPFPKPFRRNSQIYAHQNLSTGHWLGYGGVDMPKDPTSPTAKQKSRQRALSTGEAQLQPSEATLAAVQQAKEDALFRSAYSSFAPSRDDSSAIVPEETKNMVWWQKVGEKRFHETFPIDPALLGPDDVAEGRTDDTTNEAEHFKEAVENFAPAEAEAFTPEEKSDLEKSTDDVLKEISELLETLASHQRIRNSSLATNPRTPVIQNSSLATLAGSPSTPSSEEVDIYQILKSQLSLLISQLPPYAVAKLNGDQLEELNISRTILVETEDHRGVLEDDPATALAKSSMAAGAVGTPSLTRIGSSGTTHHYNPSNSQYARTHSSGHSSARPVQAAQSYFPQQQSVHRSPSVQYQRSASGLAQSYQTPGAAYGSGTPRQGYAANPAYGQQTPRPAYGQATPGQYYSQQPSAPNSYGGVANSQVYQSSPSTQHHNRYSQAQQSQNGYYPRSQNAPSYNYGAAQTPHARTASPLKAGQPVAQASFGAFRTPVPNGQVRSTYNPQAMSASQYGSVQPSTPTTGAPAGYGVMNTNHQQAMLDRQQASQTQARMAAQSSFRQGSGTPQPPTPQFGGQPVNGTPMVS